MMIVNYNCFKKKEVSKSSKKIPHCLETASSETRKKVHFLTFKYLDISYFIFHSVTKVEQIYLK